MNAILEQITQSFAADGPVWAASFAAFTAVLAVWLALRQKNPVSKRAVSVAARQQELRTALLATPSRRSDRERNQAFMAQVLARLRLLQGNKAQAIRDKLAQAGFRSREALITFLFSKLLLPVVFAVAAIIVLEVLRLYPMGPMGRVIAGFGAVILGAYGPEIWLNNLIARRRKALTRSLPDGLDLLVICVEAGLGLDPALKRCAGELARGSPELADEFSLTSVELGFLPDRADALRNLARRTGVKAISAVVNALVQTEKFGTPLAQSLRVLAAEFRNERLLKAEEKAARLPATLTVPMVVFILPVLFIVLVGPAVLRVLDQFVSRGVGG
jgi:tight adherence protein C